MEDINLLNAVERYIRGEMSAEERMEFEQLRQSNSEVDQMVVAHTMFLQQLDAFGEHKKYTATLHEVHNDLVEGGSIKEEMPKARLIDMFLKYRRVLGAAAVIASIIALAISGLVAYLTPKGSVSEIEQLKKELNSVKISQKQTQNEINHFKTNAPSKPSIPGKFGGTGFMIDGKGYLVTSAHIVKAADSVYVVNSKGEYFKADVLHANDNTDIAILKIHDARFQPYKSLPYSIKKSAADLGEPVFTLGYPRAEVVYNEGYLSAKTGYLGDTITCQIAISANPGNSGGPIFNSAGEVIGVLSGKQTTAEGVVFSSKSKNIYRSLDSLKKEGNKAVADLRLNTGSSIRGMNRVQQVKHIQDYVFNVLSY